MPFPCPSTHELCGRAVPEVIIEVEPALPFISYSTWKSGSSDTLGQHRRIGSERGGVSK